MLRKLYLLLLAVLSLMSCKESEKDTALRLVKEWDGKEIKFPARSVFTIQGKDTVDFDFKDADYKVVTYVDSIGCTSCKMQLNRWKQLIAKIDSVTDGNVPVLFYFHPKDIKELHYLTRRDNFTYPVCFDEKDEFNSLNQFPDEMMFQTFLLDKDNKVQVIGNPVLNPSIRDLYLKRLGMKSIETLPNTKVGVLESEHDMGRIPLTDTQTYVFNLLNTGDSPLIVSDAVPSCDCTQAVYNQETLPGDTLKLKVIYTPEELGSFYRSVDLYLNTIDSPITLWIKGEVVSKEK